MVLQNLRVQTTSKFFELLKELNKEHYRKRTDGNVEFYSAWEYNPHKDNATLHLQSKKFSYVICEVSKDGHYKIVFQLNPTNQTSNLGLEIVSALKGAKNRLNSRKLNKRGGGFKKGFCMKHGCGSTAAKRLDEAVKASEISEEFKEALKGLDIGMSYTP